MNVATISRVIGTALAGIMLVYWSLISLYWISMIAYGALLLFTMMLRIDEGRGKRGESENSRGKSGGIHGSVSGVKSISSCRHDT